jgi:hypothetical protein
MTYPATAKMDELLVQVDLYAGGVFYDAGEDVAIVKAEGSAWIDSATLAETSFHWQDVHVRLFPMESHKRSSTVTAPDTIAAGQPSVPGR